MEQTTLINGKRRFFQVKSFLIGFCRVKNFQRVFLERTFFHLIDTI